MDEKKNDQLFTGANTPEDNKQTSLIKSLVNLIQHEVNIALDQRVDSINLYKRVDELEILYRQVNEHLTGEKSTGIEGYDAKVERALETCEDLKNKIDSIEQDAIFNDNFSDLFYEEQSNNELLTRDDLRDTVADELDNLLDEIKLTRQ
tara:strand:- start:290 stop:736 length:447 start_codon:yes stop_codon:yes gene_type:complete